MLRIIPYDTLGHANYGWLDAKYHFSFGNYYDPGRLNFGALRVINDDVIRAGAGFDSHPHKDMEIITYVRKGAITHRDNNGNIGRTAKGDVQVMSAGNGIFHSEYNFENEETNLYQIWIEPKEKGITPKWGSQEFPREPVENTLPLLVSGDNTAPLHIHQDARIYGGRLNQGTGIEHHIRGQAYLLVSDGDIEIISQLLRKGDGAELTDMSSVNIKAQTDAEVLIIEVPASEH
ncbi:MAG: pirin family protein [Methyloligellaceae bacterium]